MPSATAEPQTADATVTDNPVIDAKQLQISKPDLPDIDTFKDVNVAWGGDLGDELAKVLKGQATASGDASDAGQTSGLAGDKPAGVEAPTATSEPNPAASDKGVQSADDKAPESERGFNLDSLTEDDFGSLLDSPTAKRLLGPRYQSERDKAYERGYSAAKASVEQEIQLARASKTLDVDDNSRKTASDALNYARTSATQHFIQSMEDALGSVAESYGLERDVATLQGKTFKNLGDYLGQVAKAVVDHVAEDRIKREAASQAKELAKALVAKRSDERRATLPTTPDFLPQGGATGAGVNTMVDADKAYIAGTISHAEYSQYRRKFGVD